MLAMGNGQQYVMRERRVGTLVLSILPQLEPIYYLIVTVYKQLAIFYQFGLVIIRMEKLNLN
jgi:hypothetical protein